MKLVLALSAFLATQSTPTPPATAPQRPANTPAEFYGVPTSDPPDRPGAWSVVVAKRGGIAAFGMSFVTTTSAGAVTCGGQTVPCRSAIGKSEVSALAALITRAVSAFDTAYASVCSDCARTFVVLTRRDENGRLQRQTASWDVTTQDKVPPDLVRLVSTTTGNALQRPR